MKKYYFLLLIFLIAVIVYAVDTTTPLWTNQQQVFNITQNVNIFSVNLSDETMLLLNNTYLSTNESGSWLNYTIFNVDSDYTLSSGGDNAYDKNWSTMECPLQGVTKTIYENISINNITLTNFSLNISYYRAKTDSTHISPITIYYWNYSQNDWSQLYIDSSGGVAGTYYNPLITIPDDGYISNWILIKTTLARNYDSRYSYFCDVEGKLSYNVSNSTNYVINYTWSNNSVNNQVVGWKIGFSDTSGNYNETSIMTFIVDSINPSLILQSPINTTYTTTNISLNYTVSDTNLNTSWYQYNGTNTTLSGNTTFTALNNQQSNLTLYSNDTAGNLNSTTVFFSVDASAPTYTNLAVNSTNIRKNDTIKFSALWNDLFAGLSKFIFSWNVTGTWVNQTYNFSGNWSNITANMTANKTQEIAYIIYANDTYNNTNATTQASFVVNNTAPVVVPSIIPSPTDGSQPLNCTYSYSDADNDAESAQWFLWYNNDALLSSVTQNLTNGNFTNNDNIICSVKVNDGTDNSTWVNSTTLTINDNIMPVYNSITFSATSGTVNTPFTVTVNLTETNSMDFSKMEVENPNQELSNLTMTASRNGSIYIYSVSYTPIIVGNYSFKFYAKDGSGNSANYTSSVTYTASSASLPPAAGGGGSTTVITQCGNRVCEINENTDTCAVDCAAKFVLYEPQFDRELKKVVLEGGLFGGNTYEFRIKNLMDEDINMTFSTNTSWLKFDMGGSERSVFTSKLNRKGATDSGIGYIRLVAHTNASFSNTTLGEFQVTDKYTTSAIPVIYVKSDTPDYSEYVTLPNVGIGLLGIIGLVFFVKKA